MKIYFHTPLFNNNYNWTCLDFLPTFLCLFQWKLETIKEKQSFLTLFPWVLTEPGRYFFILSFKNWIFRCREKPTAPLGTSFWLSVFLSPIPWRFPFLSQHCPKLYVSERYYPHFQWLFYSPSQLGCWDGLYPSHGKISNDYSFFPCTRST